MITVHYQLIDTFENYKEFNTVAETVKWAKGIGEDMFVYIHVQRPFLVIDSYQKLMEYGERVEHFIGLMGEVNHDKL